MISLVATENSINNELIPQRPKSGCPEGTFDGMETCFCEDHCSWEVCRLLKPPQKCLASMIGAIWAWDREGEAWRAQGNEDDGTVLVS